MARTRARILDQNVFSDILTDLIGAKSGPMKVGEVLVALSGGPDSVALLHLMHNSAQRMGFKVVAAHVNYGLRGKESDGDEKFCRDLCRQLGIKLYVKRVNLSRKGKAPPNLQAEARRIRYEFFDEISAKRTSTGLPRVTTRPTTSRRS